MKARTFVGVCALALSGLAGATAAGDAQERAALAARQIAAELSHLCPASGPGDQAAFDACRAGLYRDSLFKRSLREFVLWGRQNDAALPIKQTKLTQFGPDVLSGLYVPLFMFDGAHTVRYVESEGLYQIRLRTAFRNRLAPGQFPYPFWHEPAKWATYQSANEMLLWWDPRSARVAVVQFTALGAQPPIRGSEPVVPPAFDGQWRWTDAQGRTQPAVTVFDGLLRADNPHIGPLDTAYKKLALRLRESQCFECHVPSNPDGTKKLVLLQTPMHAAAEIQRVLKSVREDTMPRDEFGVEKLLDPRAKAALLEDGVAFERLLGLARQWEAAQR